MKRPFVFLERTHAHDRLCNLSDGVYAIALTLLVLDLKVPEIPGITNHQLRTDLLQQMPNFIAYAVAFLVIAFFWMNHHRIFQSVTRCDERALRLNLAHLLFISLTPYVTSLIGHYEEDRIATIVFSLNLGLASVTLTALASYVLGKEEWRMDDDGGTWVAIPRWAIIAGPGVAVVSIPVSFVSNTAALLLWPLLMGVYTIVLSRNSRGPQPNDTG